MENSKSLEEYTIKEWNLLDAGTKADIIWEYKKYNNKVSTLRDNLLIYSNKHRLDCWE